MPGSKPLEVLVIGAGFAGVCAAIKLLEKGITNFRVYDKADGIGGTWWHNTYPGAACDVPSHFYCYSFEPNPEWSRRYAPQAEIQAYIENCAKKYGVLPHLELGRKLLSLAYDEERVIWRATFEDGADVETRFVINGSGALHKPFVPHFEGAEHYRGPTMHTGEWDAGFDPASKRIAVIGSAASAIQVVPQLAKSAAMVSLFQRTPNYIAPRRDFAYSEEQKDAFRHRPELMRRERRRMFLDGENRLFPMIVSQKARDEAKALLALHLRSQVRIRKYREALTPDYEVGCKRVLMSDDFLASLNEDNVELVTDPIREFRPDGIVTTDGTSRAFDAIVYATGFDIEAHIRAIEIRGKGGVSLADHWKNGVEAYRSVMVPGFPNYFMATGPNSGVGTTSVVFMIEQSIGWIMRAIRAAGRTGVVSVTPEATAEHNRGIRKKLKKTVWASGCRSWYLSKNGRIEILFPGDARSYRAQMRGLDRNEVHITPRRKRQKAPGRREPAEACS